MSSECVPVLIIGSGPAGYTAAIYAARADLKPVMISGSEPGGQLMWTTDVENYPGFKDVIQGPWLMEEMKAQALHMGTKFIEDRITRVDVTKRPFECEGESGKIYKSKALIIATGAQAKWLGLESEEKFRGYGVSGCAVCDGFFFKNKEVVVIGGGNTAVEEALYLTRHASLVTVIHRRDSFRAEKILQDKLFKNDKIKVLWNSEVEEILGGDDPFLHVTGVCVKDTDTQKRTTLPCKGVFVAIGHRPQTDLFTTILRLDAHNYIEVEPGTTKTSVPGVFAAGDVTDKVYRQAVTAAGLGCMAALEAAAYLDE